MGTPSLQPFLKSFWLTPVYDWPIVAKHTNTDELERQYKYDAHDNYIRIGYWNATRLESSEHGDHRDVSFPLSENRRYSI